MTNEKRLIDANVLKSFLCKCCNILRSDEPCEPSDCNVLAVIDEQPTADAVVLPCKIGQKVYTIPRSAIREWTVVGVWISADEKCSYAHIYWEKNGHRMESRGVHFSDLGKTVFLTREEAEAALAKMYGDGK